MFSIRGATTVLTDNKEEVLNESKILLNEIIEKNKLEVDEIISVFFTCTKDIKSVYPAVAAREIGILQAGLMCMQEMYVENSLEKCIRVLIHADKKTPEKIFHVYLNEARKLRPDLLED